MSYGSMVCSNCGGEVQVYDGYGGTCHNCGHWVSAGRDDGERIMADNERFMRRKLMQVCRGKVTVYCYGFDGLVIRVTNKQDTIRANNIIGKYTRYDYNRRWSQSAPDDYHVHIIGFNKSADFDGYKLRPYEKEVY